MGEGKGAGAEWKEGRSEKRDEVGELLENVLAVCYHG